MKRYSTLGGFLLVAAVCLVAGCASKPSATTQAKLLIGGQSINALIPARERNRIDRAFQPAYVGNILIAQALGTVIQQRQHLAVRASNVYMSQPKARRSAVSGWLVTRKNGALQVLFINERGKTLRIVAVAKSAGNSTPHLDTLNPPRALTSKETALWRARALAFTAKIKPCSDNYQPVVIPVDAAGKRQIFVFLLPLAPANKMMLGGYYLIKIDAAGTRILDTHSYTRSCLEMHRNPKAVGVAVTENKSPTPTATQVYANLRYGLPVYVTTAGNHRQWKIKQGQISSLKKSAPQ
ncbi:MAG: hypothetical protein ACRETC_01225 [Gammaproteobacteria bacterium]